MNKINNIFLSNIKFRLLSSLFFYSHFDPHIREVVSKASIAFVIKILSAMLAFGFNILLARIVGAEGVGIYYLALTISSIAIVCGMTGLDNALLRIVAANAATGDWASVKGAYRKSMNLALIVSTISALAMFAVSPLISQFILSKPEVTIPTSWMALAVVPRVILFLHASALRGLKRVYESQIILEVIGPALSLVGLYFLTSDFGVIGAVWIYTGSSFICAVAGTYIWHKVTPHLRGCKERFRTRRLLKSAMPLFLSAFMNLGMQWTATFILGVWCTNTDVGIFGVAARTAMFMNFILIAFNTIVAPKFAELYRVGDMEMLESIARNSAKLMSIFGVPLLLFFVLEPRWVMGIFGQQFVDGGSVLLILAVGQFVNIAIGSTDYLLMMTGNENIMRNVFATVAIINIVLNLTLIPAFDIYGAALSTAISTALLKIISAFLACSRLKIQPIPIFLKVQNSKSTIR